MAFDYDKIKAKEESGSHWASYSDLFMVLSLVFLLLYVVASLNSGTFGIQKSIEYQRIKRENQDLRQQIKVYNTLRDDYLQTGASTQEQATYEELMGQLKLLEQKAEKEKEDLRQQALANERKEKALNKYQQMVRNIINANLISQARIKRREKIITKKDDIILEKKQEIVQLETDVAQKEAEIEESKEQITSLNSKLENKISEVRKLYKRNKISKKKMQERISKLKEQTEQQVAQLEEKAQKVNSQLHEVNQELQQANQQLTQAQKTIESKESQILELEEQRSQYANKISSLETDFEKKMKAERAAFEKQLKKEQLTKQEIAQREAEFRRQALQKEQQLQQRVSGLRSKIRDSQKELDKALAKQTRAAASLKNLKEQNQELSKDLKKAQEIANARKNLVKKIKKNLEKSGIKAQVDPGTGDVVLAFGDEYFDTGKANLKPEMTKILNKFMPLYAKSLFSDPKTAEKISNVEIVGFASPTYKGKYVDPNSMEAKDREAANYNLDLSYYRARSIFNHIFDTGKLKYQNQQRLLPLVKVTGRSFFAAGSEEDVANGISQKQYCKKYDCKKAQKVIIRFNLGE